MAPKPWQGFDRQFKAFCAQYGKGGGGNQAASGGGGGGGGGKVICQCCGKRNHTRQECRHLQDGCTECGKTGHLWEVCNQREDFHICPNKAIKGNRKGENSG